jgi:hypothetical protein
VKKRRPLIGPGSAFGASRPEAALRMLYVAAVITLAPIAATQLGGSWGVIAAIFVIGAAVTVWAAVVRYKEAKRHRSRTVRARELLNPQGAFRNTRADESRRFVSCAGDS